MLVFVIAYKKAMQVSGLPREAPYSDNMPANATLQQVELDVLINLAELTQISQQFTEPHYSNLIDSANAPIFGVGFGVGSLARGGKRLDS